MRKILHDGSTRFEIFARDDSLLKFSDDESDKQVGLTVQLARDDSLLKFSDIPAALDFLRRFKNDPAQMAILRSVIASSSRDVHRLDTEEVLKQFASLLVSSQLKILKSPQLLRGGSGAEEVEREKAKQAAKSAPPMAPRKTSWIEIHLRDMEGQPVPGKRYRIKMPDGSVEEGNLDDFGHAEYYGINPGTCAVSFPDLDAEAWERV